MVCAVKRWAFTELLCYMKCWNPSLQISTLCFDSSRQKTVAVSMFCGYRHEALLRLPLILFTSRLVSCVCPLLKGSLILSAEISHSHFHIPQKAVVTATEAGTSNPEFSHSVDKEAFYCLFIISDAIKFERVVLSALHFICFCAESSYIIPQRFKL
jgi:hypothetical protein